MTARTNNSPHYVKIMQMMDDMIINMNKCHEAIETPKIPVKAKKNLQVFCDKQKALLEKMALELSAFENAHRIILKENLVDEMTGLLAKSHLVPTIERRFSAPEKRMDHINHADCIIFIDVNNMKFLNENYGHIATDEILVQLIDIGKLFLRDADFGARMGGDELVFYVTNIDASKVARMIARRMALHLKKHPIQAVLLKDSEDPNTTKTDVQLSFCLGAANFPEEMPEDNTAIKSIILETLKSADNLEILAKQRSKPKEITIAYKNFNGDTIIETESEIMAD